VVTAAPRLDDFGGLLDWDRLQPWIAGHDLPGSGPVRAVSRLTGGSQNNIFRLERDGAAMVLRRPPRHPRAGSDATILREARVLQALSGSAVPHARLYGVCDDSSVIGSCFYLMAVIDGFTPRGPLPGRYAADPAWRRALAFEIVDAAAELGRIRPADIGLDGLGRLDGWLERQAPRWLSQLEGYQGYPAYAGRTLPHAAEVAAWLELHRPAGCVAGIIHGDLQFANVMFGHDRPRLLALIDWELSTLGDPLLDLGWILTSWSEPGDPAGHEPYIQPADGLPSRRELIERYLVATGRDPGLVPWFFVLACYKLGIIVEGTYARALSGQAPMDTGRRLHGQALWLLEKAIQLARA
jgi:aminoglycoside phosphotransferase (APT) family kinase protein